MTRALCKKCSSTGQIYVPVGATIYASLKCWDCGNKVYTTEEWQTILSGAKQ